MTEQEHDEICAKIANEIDPYIGALKMKRTILEYAEMCKKQIDESRTDDFTKEMAQSVLDDIIDKLNSL